jgi:hypothetical protein
VAAAKLINMVGSNNPGVTMNIVYLNLELMNYVLDIISKDLELIYEKGNRFFISFENSITEWGNLPRNMYSPTLIGLMKNISAEFSSTLREANSTIFWTVPLLKLYFDPINLWCNTSIIYAECKYELSRVKSVITYLSEFNLLNISYSIMNYSDDLDKIIKDVSDKSGYVISNAQTSSRLKSLIKMSSQNFLVPMTVA